jgi:predicted nucleic acid-binding protein
MTFNDLLPGAAVFLDANTLTYHFQPHPTFGSACAGLVQSIEQGQLLGFTSTHVLSELSHRLMTIEAMSLLGWPAQGIGNRLRTNPAEVQKLSAFQRALDAVSQSKMRVLTIAPALLAAGAVLCRHVGLLTNDGLIVAVMQANGLTNLASNDADFDRVPGLTRYAPL